MMDALDRILIAAYPAISDPRIHGNWNHHEALLAGGTATQSPSTLPLPPQSRASSFPISSNVSVFEDLVDPLCNIIFHCFAQDTAPFADIGDTLRWGTTLDGHRFVALYLALPVAMNNDSSCVSLTEKKIDPLHSTPDRQTTSVTAVATAVNLSASLTPVSYAAAACSPAPRTIPNVTRLPKWCKH